MSRNLSNTVLAGLMLLATCFHACNEPVQLAENSGDVKALPDQIDYNFHIRPILSDRCFACHGPDRGKQEANLALHTLDGLLADSEDGTAKIVVPGDPDASLLYQRIIATDHAQLMPPKESNLSLTPYEIALLRQWIEQGPEWKKHWAFLAPKPASNTPNDPDSDWDESTIDAWVLAGIKSNGLQPSPAAKPARLLRRMSLDTRGLPPSVDDLKDFLSNPTEEAYATKVDEYLASVDHGERLASWWLDLARYADTHGYQDDLERQNWPWRDWVIHAFQKNLSYKDFVTWQLAGDLLPDANLETILATTFNRNHKITQEGGAIPEEFLVDYVADRTTTTFTAFQGLTMECARCHDHKYDPISQKNFFQAFDFFNRVPEQGVVDYGANPRPVLELTREIIESELAFLNAPDSVLPVYPMVMKDEQELRTTHLLGRGQYNQPGEEVSANTPASILPFGEDRPGNRLGLADWLFDQNNPLTARVIVNRVWQFYFGRGIVATPDDFGSQGALPTHPELLDELALRFMDSNWDFRALERAILLSNTYRQDSRVSPEAKEIDPENIYLARSSQVRLSAEVIRDQALAVSGLLVPKVGGPPVKPYQPPGLWEEKTSGGGYTTYTPDKGESLYRKSLYTYWKRTVPPPSMLVFDAPTRDLCTVYRQETNTPLQALVLLNDPQQLEAARTLAEKTVDQYESKAKQGIEQAFMTVVCRKGSTEELEVLHALYDQELERYATAPKSADSLLMIGEMPVQEKLPKSKVAAMTIVVSTLLNLSETVTRL